MRQHADRLLTSVVPESLPSSFLFHLDEAQGNGQKYVNGSKIIDADHIAHTALILFSSHPPVCATERAPAHTPRAHADPTSSEGVPLLSDRLVASCNKSSMIQIGGQCCTCLPGSKIPKSLLFANSSMTAIGDSKVPHNRRLYLGVVFPQDAGVQPMHMYFSRTAEGVKVLEAACEAAGVKLDKGQSASAGLDPSTSGILPPPCLVPLSVFAADPEAGRPPTPLCAVVGSPGRLNLFTVEGDLLRIDLDLEAHVPSTLQPGGWVILEKGNRISPARLAEIQEAQELQKGGGGCAIM